MPDLLTAFMRPATESGATFSVRTSHFRGNSAESNIAECEEMETIILQKTT